MLSDIIEQLGGPSAVARHLGLRDYTTVSSWVRRGSIPVRYWQGLMDAAAARAVQLDADRLVRAHAGENAGEAAQAANHPAVKRNQYAVGRR